jgi:hypothetical protein
MSPPAPGSRTIEDLCPELRALVASELAAGNTIVEWGPSLYGHGGVLVLLAKPFRHAPPSLPDGVVFREINDPHWWKAEYFHIATNDCVAARC